MGSEWKKHKYIRIENGRYIYPGDEKQGKQSAQDKYKSMKVRMRRLKQNQKEYESQIDDDSLGDKKKTKSAYEAGDKLDQTLAKMDKLRARMQKQRKAYKNTFGNKMSEDIKPKNAESKPSSKEEAKVKRKELLSKLEELKSMRNVYQNSMDTSNKTANRYYKKSEAHKSNTKSDEFQINGIIGKKYESAGRRYASKLNMTDKRIDQINDELKNLGMEWFNKKYRKTK